MSQSDQLRSIVIDQSLVQPARFPASSRGARPRRVEDKTRLCSKWKEGGACRLDTHFPIGNEAPDVYSNDMFDLMQKACPKTCGWVESGCHDEHPRCEEWSRLGECVSSSTFMAHTCRESCGVCGILSLHSWVGIQTSASSSPIYQIRKYKGRMGSPTLTF